MASTCGVDDRSAAGRTIVGRLDRLSVGYTGDRARRAARPPGAQLGQRPGVPDARSVQPVSAERARHRLQAGPGHADGAVAASPRRRPAGHRRAGPAADAAARWRPARVRWRRSGTTSPERGGRCAGGPARRGHRGRRRGERRASRVASGGWTCRTPGVQARRRHVAAGELRPRLGAGRPQRCTRSPSTSATGSARAEGGAAHGSAQSGAARAARARRAVQPRAATSSPAALQFEWTPLLTVSPDRDRRPRATAACTRWRRSSTTGGRI